MSTLTADEYFEKIHGIVSLLDQENIRIVRTMKKNGPRNLQEISRRSGLPYPTVYSRVTKLEREGVLKTWVHPSYSKIGLARAMVTATPLPGKELLVREALKITGFWLRITRCLGDCNGYYSLHAVPIPNKQDLEHFLDQLVAYGLVNSYKLSWLGETYSPIPNFDYFSVKDGTWRFQWKEWLKALGTGAKHRQVIKPSMEKMSFDRNDLVILKELVKNARIPLVDLAKTLSMTLPAAKYRFDNLVRRGFVHDYVINMLPYAPEISSLLEVRLDFKGDDLLETAERKLVSLPFVLNYTTIDGMNSAALRIYLPRTETSNFLTFLSLLIRSNIITGYSYYLLEPMTIQAQTFAYKDYDDKTGWRFNNQEYLATLDNLASMRPKREIGLPSFPEVPSGAFIQQ